MRLKTGPGGTCRALPARAPAPGPTSGLRRTPGSPVLPPGGCAPLVWEVTLQASSGNVAPKADSWSRLGASPSWHPTQRWHRGLRLHPSDSRTGPHTRSLLLPRMAGATGGPAGQAASWSAQDVGSSRPSDDQARHQTDGLSLSQVKGDASPFRHFEPRRVPTSLASVSPAARGGGVTCTRHKPGCVHGRLRTDDTNNANQRPGSRRPSSGELAACVRLVFCVCLFQQAALAPPFVLGHALQGWAASPAPCSATQEPTCDAKG